jgi:hypothetical protein
MSDLFTLLKSAKITLPVMEITSLIVGLSICLANKWTRSGLLIAYVFVYRWGWMFFAKQSMPYFLAYLVLGGLVLVLSVYDMMGSKE